jgi:hypothetical protein
MTVATSRRRKPPRTKGKCATGCICCTVMALMHLLSECSPDSLIAEDRLLHELALLPSKNRVVQRNPLNLGCRSKSLP